MKYNSNTVNPNARVCDQAEYSILTGMKQRCYDPNFGCYDRYGGRGIKVCNRWLERGGLWNFLEDMGRRPSKEYSIDRIDNDKGYSPENCQWATQKEQCKNRRVRKDNKVGLSGVNYDKTSGRWVARKVNLEGKRVCLGYYHNLSDAKNAVLNYGIL